jgi:hypothetical protein
LGAGHLSRGPRTYDWVGTVERNAGHREEGFWCVDYEEKKDSPFAEMDRDLRRDYPGKTWHQIRAERREVDDNDAVGIVDEYKDVDEYHTFSCYIVNTHDE